MNIYTLIIVGILGVWVGMYLARRRNASRVQEPIEEQSNIEARGNALAKANEARAQEKEEKKNKILELARTKGKIKNNDVEKLLGVADATATRYLEELEEEGKLKQVGKKGHEVHYLIK